MDTGKENRRNTGKGGWWTNKGTDMVTKEGVLGRENNIGKSEVDLRTNAKEEEELFTARHHPCKEQKKVTWMESSC